MFIFLPFTNKIFRRVQLNLFSCFEKSINECLKNTLSTVSSHFESCVHFWAHHLKKDIAGLELKLGLEEKSYEEELGLFSLEKVSGATILLKMFQKMGKYKEHFPVFLLPFFKNSQFQGIQEYLLFCGY